MSRRIETAQPSRTAARPAASSLNAAATMRATKATSRLEVMFRGLLWSRGLRYRLRSSLPGRPDLTFPGPRIAVFIHGCFWHRHVGCRYAYEPKSRVDFWQTKFASNVARDLRVNHDLDQRGWHVVTVWECETRDAHKLHQLLRERLDASAN